MKVAVAQLGARMHYAVPKILEDAGRLEHFTTDSCASKGWPLALKPLARLTGSAALRRFLDRVPQGVPTDKITAYNSFGIDYALRRARARNAQEQTAVHLWAGRSFCRRLIRQGLGGATHTFTYNSAGLEWMVHAKSQGLKCIMEQTIAPMALELRLMAAQRRLFPDWDGPEGDGPSAVDLEFCRREREEWDAADLILCGSPFVKDGVAECGGPVDRCVVVPYGVDSRAAGAAARTPADGRLRVLTVGAVGLRKGSPWVMEVARRCKSFCDFRMVGPLTTSERALAQLAQEVTLTGPVPRSSIRDHYAWAELFFLPSVCEGSATVVYEALACGLPVLTTPNAGSVVTQGEDGWLTPVGDVDRMAAQLEWIHQNRGALAGHSAKALDKARHYDLASYGQRFLQSLA